jgi:hypothetical protein
MCPMKGRNNLPRPFWFLFQDPAAGDAPDSPR